LIVTLILAIAVYSQTAVVITENANLRGTPTESGKVVETLSQDTVVDVLQQKGAWFLIQSTDYVGWMHGNTIRLSSASVIPKTVRTNTVPSTKSRQSSDRTYIRGPRGGCYYLNSNGNKTYVDRSLCN
jgi:hypothetical protein